MNQEKFYLLLCGFLGVLFHSLLKYKGLKEDARKANLLPFRFLKDYVVQDGASISVSLLSVLIWFFVFKEVAAKYPSTHDFARISFVTMGGIGSYIIQTFMSQAKRRIMKAVDEKTDIADGKTKTNDKIDPGPGGPGAGDG